jgi:LmeA-like phospholipid-binding
VARRGRRWLIALVVVVIVLAGLFVVADRVAVNVAENRIADQAVTAMRERDITSDRKPSVNIGGFPFLTQVLAGKYQKVTISVDHPRNGTVTLDHLTITANDVHAPLDTIRTGQGQVTADSVAGTATMGWDVVRSLIDTTPLRQVPGLDISKLSVTVKDNKVNMSAPIAFAGISLTLQTSGTLTVDKGEVRLQIEDLRAVSPNGGTSAIAPSFLNQYRDRLNVKIAIPTLPYSLVVNKVQTSNSGVLVTATAANVVLSGQA